jgi:prevent-host-death family protein
MDLKEAKNLIDCKGERVILVENGNPTIVLMSYDSYKKIAKNSNEDVKTDIVDLSNGGEVKQENNKKEEGTELTLDDLPF